MSIDPIAVLAAVSNAGTFNHQGRQVCYWDNASGSLSTLQPGTPYQPLIISFMFGGGTILHMGGNIRLAGAVNKTFSQYDTLTLCWVNQLSEWHEIARSLNH